MHPLLQPIFWRAFQALPVEQRRRILYKKWIGHPLPKEPTTFTEKIQWRIIRDRRELIARGGDKISMKNHAHTADPSIAIPRTLWFGEDLTTVYDRHWGTDWVLKPTTGSGHAAFGSGSLKDAGIDITDVTGWNEDTLAKVHGEWAYSQARPGYLIEERIPTANGESPHDIRFFVFDGKVQVIQVDSPRSQQVHRRFYTPEWVPLDVNQGGKILAEPQPAPETLALMLDHAARIGADFDFIRVDLYEALGKVWFGEITPYPTGGLDPFTDPAFDALLGSYWDLAVKP